MPGQKLFPAPVRTIAPIRSLEDLADVCCREAGRVAVRNERLRKFNVVWLR